MRAIDRVRDTYGADLPDWVEALALKVDETSQNATARALGYSAGVVHSVLRNTYGASTVQVEERVRGLFMAETVNCPALGVIGTDRCQGWRRKARHFSNANAQDVMMYRACHRCPRNRKDTSDATDHRRTEAGGA